MRRCHSRRVCLSERARNDLSARALDDIDQFQRSRVVVDSDGRGGATRINVNVYERGCQMSIASLFEKWR